MTQTFLIGKSQIAAQIARRLRGIDVDVLALDDATGIPVVDIFELEGAIKDNMLYHGWPNPRGKDFPGLHTQTNTANVPPPAPMTRQQRRNAERLSKKGR